MPHVITETARDARQGEMLGTMRYVLALSTIGTIVALGITALFVIG
jgi:hypothetical protein